MKFFSPPDREYRASPTVWLLARAKSIVSLLERTGMMCPRKEDLKVFLAKGLFCRDLSVTEVGVVNFVK